MQQPVNSITWALAPAEAHEILRLLSKMPIESHLDVYMRLRMVTQMQLSPPPAQPPAPTPAPAPEVEPPAALVEPPAVPVEAAPEAPAAPPQAVTHKQMLLDAVGEGRAPTNQTKGVPGEVLLGNAREFLKLAEDNRREPSGGLSVSLGKSESVHDDYSGAGQVAASAMQHLDEAIPNGQAMRSHAALNALEAAVPLLRRYLTSQERKK